MQRVKQLESDNFSLFNPKDLSICVSLQSDPKLSYQTTIKNITKLLNQTESSPTSFYFHSNLFNFNLFHLSSQLQSTNKDMTSDFKRFNVPSRLIMTTEDQLSRKSFSLYDQQPTILFQSSRRESINRRQSFNNSNYRPLNSHTSHKAKLLTCESNLIQSSPERSQSSRVDGEFVCKYLTPIKKQQFHQMLFQDEILKDAQNKNTLCCEQTDCCKCPNMVKSFKPVDKFNELSQLKTRKNQEKNRSNCRCESGQKYTDQKPGKFIDLPSQVNFLKSNNHDLFTKLQKQIEKNKNLQSEVDRLSSQNKSIRQIHQKQQNQIIELKKLLKKYDQERAKYLAKEWEQFHFVKEMLYQKKRSNSKTSNHISSTKKLQEYSDRQDQALKQIKKKLDRTNQSSPKNHTLPEKLTLSKQSPPSRTQSVSNFIPSPSVKLQSVRSQTLKRQQSQKKRNLSFENFSQRKTKEKKNKQNQQMQKFLKNKLQVNIPLSSSSKKNQTISQILNHQKRIH